MAKWLVKPTDKKSIIEMNTLIKDGNQIVVETVWRSGEFYVYTDDDNPPVLEPGVDLYNCDYETELVETSDGVYEDVNTDECDDETQAFVDQYLKEGNSWLDLECEHAWMPDECQMIIDCEMSIERVEE